MIYEWDESKRQSNLFKHGLDFADCTKLFADATVTYVDDRFAYGESRFVTFGLLYGRVVVVVHTETSDVIRIISMRRASKHEQAYYFEKIPN